MNIEFTPNKTAINIKTGFFFLKKEIINNTIGKNNITNRTTIPNMANNIVTSVTDYEYR